MSSELSAVGTRALILDANILVRAVLGRRVLALLLAYATHIHFLAPEIAFTDVRRHLPGILIKRGLSTEAVTRLVEQEVLGRLPALITPAPHGSYANFEGRARRRLAGRDEADWPFVALALRLACPIWTEDQDFFGIGVPTWTADRVEIYLQSAL